MRHAILRFTSGLAFTLGACIVGCTLVQKSDDGDGTGGNAPVSLGGSQIGVGQGGSAGKSATAGGTNSGGGNGVAQCDSLKGIDASCGTTSKTADVKTVNMLLVIDKSGSMVDKPPGFDQSKWDALQTALAKALRNVQDDINFGMLLYPFPVPDNVSAKDYAAACNVNSGPSAVNVPIGSGANAVSAIASALKDTTPFGGTPTAAALKAAYDYFTGEGLNLAGDKYVLLATDGGPNCNVANSCATDASRCTPNLDATCSSANCCTDEGRLCLDDQEVVKQISALQKKGIPTFVVGIPGTEVYRQYLDSFAEAGGQVNPDPDATSKYYAVEASQGLQGLIDVFSTITTQLVRSCDIGLAENPPDKDKLNVAVDCEVVPQSEDSWVLDDSTDPFTVVLKGDTCDRVKTVGARRVDVVYGCATIR